MPADTRLDLHDIPDSPHARELRRGLDQLRFAPPLEADYLRRQLDAGRPRLRCFTLLAFATALIFAALALGRDGGWSAIVAVHVLLVVPITIVLLVLVWTPLIARAYLPAARVLAPTIGALSALLASESIGGGAHEDLAIPPLVVIAIFMFMGLQFRTALTTGVVSLVAFTVAGLVFALPDEVFVKGVILLSATALVAALIGRDVELHQRQRFLEEAIIAELVERDSLTGLRNRRAFDTHLHRVWQQCVREGRLLGLLFIDIDYFKRYNDEYGHQAGDAALHQVGQAAQACARRPLDLAARFGGEEFCVVLYGAAPADVASVAEQLRHTVERLGIEHRASACSDVVTVSIGVAIVQPRTGQAPQGALQLADDALYRAKGAGRNRCQVLVGDAVSFGAGARRT
jgi:diguanylate cyclase (GGDEF)-like protein